MVYHIWLVVTGTWLDYFFPFHIAGMASKTHWRTPSFFKMVCLHHHPGIYLTYSIYIPIYRLYIYNLYITYTWSISHGYVISLGQFLVNIWWDSRDEWWTVPDDAPGHRGDSSTLCALHARRSPQSLGWCGNILEERLGVCLKVRYPIPKVYRQLSVKINFEQFWG
jgi:hypothetical protein